MDLRISIFYILPGFPALHVEFVAWILSIDFRLKFVSSESKDSLTESSKLIISIVDVFSGLIIERSFLSVNKDLRASVEDSLGGTLHENAKAVFLGLWVSLLAVHVTNKHVELYLR
jgi:hypothetical protein